MRRVPVGIGTEFLLGGRKYKITNEIEKETFIAKDLNFENVEEKFTLHHLLHQLQEGNLEFSVQGKSTSIKKSGIYDVEDFSMLSEEKQEEAKLRHYAIEPLLKLEVKALNPYIKSRKEQLFKEGYQVSEASLYRWIKAYRESDGSIYSLVSNTHKRGVKDSRLEKEVDILIDSIIDEHYLVRENRTITTIYELVINEIDKENDKRELDEKMNHPSLSTIRRRINARDTYEVEKARKGANAIRNKFKQVQYHEKPKYPLQRVEIDHTLLDIVVLDNDTLLPIGRPTITSVLDVYTGYPLGYYIGFEPPSYTSVMLALLHAISPKTYVKKRYPKVKNEWLAYGLPELLVVDNGKEFLSKHLKEACLELGIEIYHCPVKMPWYKGPVERHFRTINQELLHQTPGTTFSNVLMKGDYDPAKNASIRFDALLEMFHKWLLDYYCQKPNKGVKGAPAKLWNKWFEQNPRPEVPSNMLDWKIKLMKLGYGSIQSQGIRRLHLYYQDSELHVIRRKLERAGKKNKVKYKYDPTDLSKIYVFDEMDQKYIEVKCTDDKFNYTEGINEYAHRVIVKKARDEEKKIDISAIAAAKAELIQLMKDEKANSIKQRKQKQRLNNIGSNQVFSEEPPPKTIKDLEVPEPKETQEPEIIEKPETITKLKPERKIEEATKRKTDMFFVDIENDWDDFDVG
ncbi:Mu transposase C-terminal domain-containing protein [Metabacillus litoralis]|uniref:Mu transposase C-terminal domain-containing protein n=1 Tax=Metabacillus litoralis TaxID=152268 RepID=UPI00204007A4|nr:Mu transposase C-terminal domain-containing protein [Metabacillus litoralis]MCM3412663.1 DDE-type integrase/transposase/recombinase [Metabacillus litoralis]